MLYIRQLVENVKRQSVEGLALPFLANWLLGEQCPLFTHLAPAALTVFVNLGDITNLAG